MEKLELKDIIGYLPYNCGFISTEYIPTSYSNGIREGYKGVLDRHWLEYIDRIKIVLYPITNLYEKRLFKGKEIIPLVELAKMAFPNYEWIPIIEGNRLEYKFVKERDGYNFFYYNGFILYDEEDSQHYIKDQYKLYDFMHELHIDYRGLIDKGLAIDINTLSYENNN